MSERPHPHIVGVDLAQGPDHAAIMSWRDGVRMVHAVPYGSSVTFFRGQIVVAGPSHAAYTVNPETGSTRPIDLATTPADGEA